MSLTVDALPKTRARLILNSVPEAAIEAIKQRCAETASEMQCPCHQRNARVIITRSVPSALALDPTGKYLFSASTNGLLEVYSTETDLLAGSVQLAGGPNQIIFNADGTRAFVSHYDEYGDGSKVGGISVVSIPEPSTFSLLALGGLLLLRRRKN